MATGQQLRGLVGQGMAGRKKSISPAVSVLGVAVNNGGDTEQTARTFTAPAAGWFRFALWGPGGGRNVSNGGGGELFIADRPLAQGQTVALSIGAGTASSGATGATTATLPSGEVLSAAAGGNGPDGLGGTTSGPLRTGDIRVAGLAGTSANTGGAAGSYAGYNGGAGGKNNAVGDGGVTPGGGSGTTSGAQCRGGDGLVIISEVRIQR